MSFRVGEEDAALLAKHFGGDYQPKHYSNLDNYTVCVKQLRNGVAQDPFIGQTHLLQAPEWLAGKKVRYLDPATIIRQSRRHYAERRHVVAVKIERWMTKGLPATGEGGKKPTRMVDAEIRRRAATLPRKGRTPPGRGGFKSIGDILRR